MLMCHVVFCQKSSIEKAEERLTFVEIDKNGPFRKLIFQKPEWKSYLEQFDYVYDNILLTFYSR